MRLVLDLGDAFTKGIAVDGGRAQRLRFPSVVASRLLDAHETAASLLVDDRLELPRPVDFDLSRFPRTRSYPGAEELLSDVSGQLPSRARFAGWPAAAYGEDRQLLGSHPTVENVAALVRKALILLTGRGIDCGDTQLVLVIDHGPKADAIARYAAAGSRSVSLVVHGFRRRSPRRVRVETSCRVVDGAPCAVAALPDELGVARGERLLVIDVGYLRTKLAILSPDGSEHQEQLASLGVSDCVRRVLRDGQDQGLVEDEFAVIRALERPHGGELQVAGRRFAIGETLASARRALEEELARAARRAVVELFGRRGAVCRRVAIVGGGAAVAGEGLAQQLRALALGFEVVWVAGDTDFLLVDGALALDHHSSSAR